MAEQIQPRSYRYGIFHRLKWAGMVRMINPFLVREGDLKLVLNWNADNEIGALNVRPGYSTFLDAPDTSSVQAVIPFYDKTGGLTLLRYSGTFLYKWTSGISWGASVKTMTASKRLSFVPYYNKLFLANGSDAFFYYDPTTATFSNVTTGTPPTDCKYLEVFQNRVFAAGTSAAPSRLYFSKVYDGTNWTIDSTDPSAASSLDIDPEFGGKIVGIKNVNNRLVIYKESAIYRYDGNSVVKIPTNESITSAGSISDIEGVNYFANRDGIFSYDGSLPREIGFAIDDLKSGISGSAWTDLQAASFDFRYYLSVGNITDADGNSYTNAVFIYDRRFNHFYLYSFYHQPNCWATWIDSSGNNYLYFGSTNGQVYKFGSGTSDAGQPIQAVLQTHLDSFGAPELTKDYDWVYPFLKQGLGTKIFYALDEGQFKLLTEIHQPYKKILFPDKAKNSKNISFKIAWSGTTNPPTFRGYTLNVEPSVTRLTARRGGGVKQ